MNLFSPGTKPTLISKQFSFTEGPAVDRDGNIFFTDQPNNKIWKYTTEGELKLFTDDASRANGMYFDLSGNLVACADEEGQLVSFNSAAEKTVLTPGYKGTRLNGPNDCWIDSKGGIYFTDPYYERDYWKEPKPKPHKQNVYYLPRGAVESFIVDEEIIKPNGIVGSADGKHLFVADIEGNKTYKYEIQPDGKLSNKKLFTAMGSDGMTIDDRGNVYLTGNGVTIFNPEGEKISHIPIEEGWTGNLCFGGKKRNELFITASKGVYTLPMLVNGIK